jgi:calcyclin binding protein
MYIYTILMFNLYLSNMDSSTLQTIERDLEELNTFLSQSKRANIIRILQDQKTLLESSLKSEKNKLQQELEKKSEEGSSTTNKNESINYITVTKYAFDNNNDKFAKVYFTEFTNIKSHDQNKIACDFKPNSFSLAIHDWNGKNLRFSCNNLNKSINPTDSYFKSTASGIIVYLKKEKADFWDSLEKKKSMIPEPSSDNSIKDDPSAGLMNMMKEMYQNGDDQTKRMIAESWSKAQEGKGMGDMGGMPGMGGMPDLGGMGGMPDMSNFDFSKLKK